MPVMTLVDAMGIIELEGETGKFNSGLVHYVKSVICGCVRDSNMQS